MNLRRFDVLLDNKLSVIKLYLFFVFLLFLLRSKDDQNEQQFSQILPYYQERKVQQVEASISKTKYRGTRKLDMWKPFAFFSFQDLDLVVSQIGNEMEEGKCKVLYEEEGTIQQNSILHEDNSALHPFISYNTVKNVIVSLFRTPVLYSVLVRLLVKILIHSIEGFVL